MQGNIVSLLVKLKETVKLNMILYVEEAILFRGFLVCAKGSCDNKLINDIFVE